MRRLTSGAGRQSRAHLVACLGTLPKSTNDISAPDVTEHALVPANPAALEARRSAARESPIEFPTFPANPALHES
jgi:hypothetical protein